MFFFRQRPWMPSFALIFLYALLGYVLNDVTSKAIFLIGWKVAADRHILREGEVD